MQKKPTLTDAQIADLKAAFEAFDQDGNGTITALELETFMRGVLGDATPSKDQIQVIIKAVDADNSGTIDFGEFLTLMSDPKFNLVDEHRQVFDMFDKDGSGHISVAELRETFKSIGQKLNDEELTLILEQADLDGDRHIDYEEFLKMFKLEA